MEARGVKLFVPELWGSLQKFSHFYSGTYQFKKSVQRSISGAINHFNKGLILKNLALQLIPTLEIDETELKQNGYTSARNSHQISAVIESSILELYSSLDCTRKVITEIYSKYQGIPNSTRKYFANIKNKKVDDNFPQELVIAVTEAIWYDQFLSIRDELTHLDVGTCFKNRDTQKINYMHSGVIKNENFLIIDDIFQYIEQLIHNVNQFTGRTFSYLLTQLKDEPILQFCGVFNGRMYTRYVSPNEAIDFNSGICSSKEWFDLEENPTCIFAHECGAYRNIK